MSSTALVVVIVVVALGFDYTNGFHDSANAIATSISTKALTPRVALAMAAVANVVGALISVEVAKTIGGGIVVPAVGRSGLVIVLAALFGAIVWNLGTWYFGLPSSSSHALIGALLGAGLAGSESVHWDVLVDKVVIPMVASPLIGFAVSYLFMVLLLWVFRKANAVRANRNFRWAQIASAATMSFGHGTQDAQKTMGVIFLALTINGDLAKGDDIPFWVIISSALAISLGTYSGGWRIMRTLGRRIISLTPVSGFAAQTVASGVMLATAHYGLPVSTTHVISSSIMGVGSTRRFSAVRWGVAGNIVVAWVLTIPAAAAVAAVVFYVLHPLLK
ncbi:inorganic phosphate transporter, PiT family [Jatrophihabitans endophyticus]|uniref:Inorganic phosphate transporter, PiT family n=1 Tax=Jatrophihabitans endophyticus TaxID=1206085 RepID=A0A1M5MCQ9_9ACTN|nr:inorganic phosphate transporter [Jatrophihabitans endophyticus]SHG75100.1 inorganic phosphate transporter, PiT family [Jatrophihabitans endophyticus]